MTSNLRETGRGGRKDGVLRYFGRWEASVPVEGVNTKARDIMSRRFDLKRAERL